MSGPAGRPDPRWRRYLRFRGRRPDTDVDDELRFHLEMRDHEYRESGMALRQIVRAPSFAIATMLTLALGIGANSALFSLVDAV
jgi:hypothetical protein